jgi:hypothetical protein
MIRLSASEIVGLPWLVRLRNAAAVWWLRRELDAGVVQNASMRINSLRQTLVYLEQHAERMRVLGTRHA